jgi:putative spermidine/putrescine transport system substrate-binding protein
MKNLFKLVSLIVISIFFIGSAMAADKPYTGKTLKISLWGGKWRDAAHKFKGSVIEQKTGAKVEYVVGNAKDNIPKAIAAAKRNAPPPFDVIELAEDGSQFLLTQANLLDKIDYSKLPNSISVRPVHKREFLAAFFSVNCGIIYRKDKFEEAGIPAPLRYEDLFRPELAPKVSLPNSNVTMWPYMMVALALSAGGSEKNIDPAFEKIRKANVQDYFRSSAATSSRIAAGEIWASVFTNGVTFRLINAGEPVAYVDPYFGLHNKYRGFEYVDLIGILKGTKVPELAYMYVNLSLDPQVQYEQAKVVGYGPTNKKIEETFLTDPILKDRYLWRKEDLAKIYRMDWDTVMQNYPKWIDKWNRTIAR